MHSSLTQHSQGRNCTITNTLLTIMLLQFFPDSTRVHRLIRECGVPDVNPEPFTATLMAKARGIRGTTASQVKTRAAAIYPEDLAVRGSVYLRAFRDKGVRSALVHECALAFQRLR